MQRFSTLLILLGMLACSEDLPPDLYDLGDPCRSATPFCFDVDTVRVCEDNVWALSTCEDVCTELGPAWVADGCENQCVCVPADPNGCTPGEALCADESTLRTCSETQEWEDAACQDLCAAEALNSAGCRMGDEPWMKPDACWCTSEGTPCTDEEPSCVDAQTLARCEAGVWVFEDCAASCGGAGVCDPFAELDACACEM